MSSQNENQDNTNQGLSFLPIKEESAFKANKTSLLAAIHERYGELSEFNIEGVKSLRMAYNPLTGLRSIPPPPTLKTNNTNNNDPQLLSNSFDARQLTKSESDCSNNMDTLNNSYPPTSNLVARPKSSVTTSMSVVLNDKSIHRCVDEENDAHFINANSLEENSEKDKKRALLLDELTTACRNVQEFDLSYNQFADWNEIKELLSVVKRLRWLNLRANPLPSAGQSTPEPLWWSTVQQPIVFTHLRTLILNACRLPFDTLVRPLVLNHFPMLEELHLADNGYSNPTTTSQLIQEENVKQQKHNSLTSLFLNNNRIEKWSEVCRLASLFPNLRQLFVGDNPLRDFDDEEDAAEIAKYDTREIFKNLRMVSINRIGWRRWSSVSRLGSGDFPALEHVRLAYSGDSVPPILAAVASQSSSATGTAKARSTVSKREIRCHVGGDELNHRAYVWLVAHLSDRLTHLNGSELSVAEKERCERALVRDNANIQQEEQMEAGESGNPDWERYEELERRHGRLGQLVDIDLGAFSSFRSDDGENRHFFNKPFHNNSGDRQWKVSANPMFKFSKNKLPGENKINNSANARSDSNKKDTQKQVGGDSNHQSSSNSSGNIIGLVRVKWTASRTDESGENSSKTTEQVCEVRNVDTRQTVGEFKRQVAKALGGFLTSSTHASSFKLFYHSTDIKEAKSKSFVYSFEWSSSECDQTEQSSVDAANKIVADENAVSLSPLSETEIKIIEGTAKSSRTNLCTKVVECKLNNKTLKQMGVQCNDLFEAVQE